MPAIFNNNGDFATRIAAGVLDDLMSLQATQGQPESEATDIVSDPLLPDRNVVDRLGHFDPDIYDLSENSHLMRLLQVLLGAPGSGGIRKQIVVARLQNSFRGMHFLDLDRFYGAMFGIRRTSMEALPDFGTLNLPADFDPYTDAAGNDAWDDLHSRDASYRNRLIQFARAIPLGGTYAGLRAAAEALLSVECEIYESWTWVDEQNAATVSTPVLVYTWSALAQLNPTWGQAGGNNTWSNMVGGAQAGTYFLGRTGQKNRGEVLIQPKRRIRPDEQYEAVRVMDLFTPAGTQLTVDPEGLAVHSPVPLRAVAADSEYWEVIYKTTPNPALVSPVAAEPVYPQPDPAQPQPRPCFSSYQGEKWCHNGDITKVLSYQMIERAIVSATNFGTVVFKDGSSRAYLTSQALLDGALVLAARAVADGVMTSKAYSSRVTQAQIKNATEGRR
jgi:hypothetical protein